MADNRNEKTVSKRGIAAYVDRNRLIRVITLGAESPSIEGDSARRGDVLVLSPPQRLKGFFRVGRIR